MVLVIHCTLGFFFHPQGRRAGRTVIRAINNYSRDRLCGTDLPNSGGHYAASVPHCRVVSASGLLLGDGKWYGLVTRQLVHTRVIW